MSPLPAHEYETYALSRHVGNEFCERSAHKVMLFGSQVLRGRVHGLGVKPQMSVQRLVVARTVESKPKQLMTKHGIP